MNTDNVIPAWRMEAKRQEKQIREIQVVEYEGKAMSWDEFMRFCCSLPPEPAA